MKSFQAACDDAIRRMFDDYGLDAELDCEYIMHRSNIRCLLTLTHDGRTLASAWAECARTESIQEERAWCRALAVLLEDLIGYDWTRKRRCVACDTETLHILLDADGLCPDCVRDGRKPRPRAVCQCRGDFCTC